MPDQILATITDISSRRPRAPATSSRPVGLVFQGRAVQVVSRMQDLIANHAAAEQAHVVAPMHDDEDDDFDDFDDDE